MSQAQPWPADAVERRAVAALVPYARNARTHSPAQVDQIAASIREWGWTVPVLVDEDSSIIAGHGRVLAAQKLGIDDIPVMVARGWTDAQRRAYVLADNKLALNAGWDAELLKIELAELQAEGADLALTGFSPGELSGFLADPDLMDPTDGDGAAGGEGLQTLKWGRTSVPLTAEEMAQLDAAFARHVEVQGVKYGFARAILGEV